MTIGNHPPWGILGMLAARKARSTSSNGTVTARAFAVDQRHRSTSTRKNSNVVIAIVARTLQRGYRRTADVVAEALSRGAVRVPGTAIFMFKDPDCAPPAMLSNLRHNHVLHERTVIVSVLTADIPRVAADERVALTPIDAGVLQVVVTFGYIDEPDVIAELRRVELDGEPIDVDDATYFIGRETVTSIPEGEMARWREHLFVVLNRGAASASRFYHLPSTQVFEVGTQVDI